jgi:hypothetical protein
MVSKTQVKAALNGIQAVAEAIRGLGEVPNGHLYAQLMGVMDHRTYESIIGLLKRAGLVSESGNLLTWTGPALELRPADHRLSP